MSKILLCAEHIRKKYGGRMVLDDINLTLRQGEAVALVGENGCGKSTLLRILAGTTAPTAGSVRIAPQARLGLIPDRYEKTPLTVARFMSHMLSLEKPNTPSVSDYYRMFALEDMLDMPMKYLSKGTLQKVATVQALAGQRDLLFVDEPLSGQDAESMYHFAEELGKRKRNGMAIVMAVHEPRLIETLADRIYEIRDGLLCDGTDYAYRFAQHRCVFMLRCTAADVEALLCKALPETKADVSACGLLTRLEADSTQASGILRALVAQHVHIVKFEEGETPC